MTSNEYQIISIRSLEVLQSLRERIELSLGESKYERFVRIIEKTVILIAEETKTQYLSATCYVIKKKDGDNSEVSIYEIGETWTSPEHRRKGLFSLLVTSAIKLIDSENKKWLVYGTPNSQSTPGYEKLKFLIKDTDVVAYYFPRLVSFFMSRKAIPIKEKNIERLLINNKHKRYKTWVTNSGEELNWRLVQNEYDLEIINNKKKNSVGLVISRGDMLGGYNVKKVSRVMYEGQNDLTIYELILMIRKEKKLTKQLGYDGLYFFESGRSMLKMVAILLLGGIFHRRIKICYKTNVENIKFKNFNIIDSDIA